MGGTLTLITTLELIDVYVSVCFFMFADLCPKDLTVAHLPKRARPPPPTVPVTLVTSMMREMRKLREDVREEEREEQKMMNEEIIDDLREMGDNILKVLATQNSPPPTVSPSTLGNGTLQHYIHMQYKYQATSLHGALM